ncbi:ExeA family protein [Desulfuromonas acetexigens]|uniref:AAA family ATPase n=1 Tax=Trichloromonas acetexigens TaxID=38815 RepID=A0A550JL93_9BACT|nr:AAA family ATPase [Desulfuromonas acetexigens]TRO83943.1 AAA family ATPase [Desulfuromonas acetexigens]
MYLDFYGFQEKPFTLTPNPRFVYLSRNHREVLAHLLYGIEDGCGFIAITGEVGTGKTTVLRALLEDLDNDRYRLAFIFNPSVSALDLLRAIQREFAIEGPVAEAGDLLHLLNEFLLRQRREGRTVVLVIDEAQHLDPAVLEQIRLLSNLETQTDKLIQIVLVGQPELGALLKRRNMRQLNQRISVRYHLGTMDLKDTCEYVRHRLRVAGGDEEIFTPAALRKIHRYSGGLPRLINLACGRALLLGYAREERVITAKMAALAIRELSEPGRCWWRRLRFWR